MTLLGITAEILIACFLLTKYYSTYLLLVDRSQASNPIRSTIFSQVCSVSHIPSFLLFAIPFSSVIMISVKDGKVCEVQHVYSIFTKACEVEFTW